MKILSFKEKEEFKKNVYELLGKEGVLEIKEDINFYDETGILQVIKKGWHIIKEKESKELFIGYTLVIDEKANLSQRLVA